ncbi:uncharacterized protein ARMOST_08640 [Armillaria ostoyae]|uniref:Uncharacterized protein n=1 Tax=Armillaria ostoyae TaxID=47428 RepID=A0A284R986_ARMOS|nr:uncharacterized protein ARMOST_08640 [Armillaria ostoyae]
MLKVIIKPFEQSKRFTEELRAYAIGSRTIANLRLQVGQKEDVCVVVRFPEDAMPPPCMPVPTLKRAPKVPVWNAVVPNCNLPEPKNTIATTGYRLLLYTPTLRFAVAFLHYRHRLFQSGPYDHVTLTYSIVALRPAVRKKILEVLLIAQLERQYHPEYVEIVKACTKVRSSDGKEVYHRSGRRVFVGEIPADKSLMGKTMVQLKESGRFGDLWGLLR